MKKILSVFSVCTLVFFASGCKKFVEGYEVSPNDPVDVNLEVLLTGTEVATFNNYTTNLARIPSVFMNQTAGRQFQYADLQEYNLIESTIDNEWQQLYTGGMLNAQQVIDKAGDQFKYFRGIGYILKAMNLGLATDQWGDVPDAQALKGLEGEANFSPAYDAQDVILRDIQSMLEQAITDLSSAPDDNLRVPGADDLVFGGDPGKWRNVARILKARYYNRLNKRDPNASASQALGMLDAAYADGLDAADDDMMAYHGDSGNENNQWWDFEDNRAGYLTMNQFFIDLLAGDPRLPLYAATPDDQSAVGPYYASQTAPLPLVTFFEAKFIEAEAALRAGDAARAATAYNEAVTANLTKLEVADAAYLLLHASETALTISLEKIMTQKYIAMFTQPEVWCDWRRTGFPTLTLNADAAVSEIPRRMPTSQNERLYNANAVVVPDITQRVWWDQ